MTKMPDADSRFLILPIETRARELDAKLLFALMAAKRNFQVILTQKWLVNVNFDKLPRGVFLFKSMNAIDASVMKLALRAGQTNVAWDDEGPGQVMPENYLKSVVDEGIDRSEMIFAWGDNQLEGLSAKYPKYVDRFVSTGNPRWDLLRPEFREYYRGEANALREKHGRFILMNTNFSFYNSVMGSPEAVMNIQYQAGFMRPDSKSDMEMANDLWRNEKGHFKSFIEALPGLSAAFPNHTIIVRPHPTENHNRWHEAAAALPNVKTIHEGPVIPWLLASDAVIQNGCTTGVESYTLGQPVISYCRHESPLTQWHLANHICPRATSEADLIAQLKVFTTGGRGAFEAARAKTRPYLAYNVASLDGSTASQKILDYIIPMAEKDEARGAKFDRTFPAAHSLTPCPMPPYQRLKFPEISEAELGEKANRFVALDPSLKGVVIQRLEDCCFYLKRAA